MSKPLRNPTNLSLLLAVLVATLCAWKIILYFGPFNWEANPFDRYTVFSESILHGSLETGAVDQRFHQNVDPYEPQGRQGAHWWDYSYYKGKQYHYASFLPSLLFNIPFKSLFGFYPAPQLQVIFATLITAFCVSLFILQFLSVLFSGEYQHTPRWLRITIFSFCFVGSGLFLSFGDDSVYTIPPYEGLAFLSISFLFLLTARDRNDLRFWTAAALFFSLAVASRPPLLLYGPVFVTTSLTFDRKTDRTSAFLIFLLFSAICAVILGTINYLRFDNPLEFGNRFQLNEFNNFKYPFVPNSTDLLIQRLPRGLWFHLLALPRSFNEFPFFHFPFYTPAWPRSFIHSPMGGDGMIGTLVFLPLLLLTAPLLAARIVISRDWKSVFVSTLFLCSIAVLLFQASLIWVADRYALDYRLYLTICIASCLPWLLRWTPAPAVISWIKTLVVYGGMIWTFAMGTLGLLARYHG